MHFKVAYAAWTID
ncbi:Protein of unknown function [Bacillus mycoides]|nr:Protein of unknown function [Bacillus mycoides]